MAEDSQQATRRTHHTWTANEDELLIQCLLEIGDNWKSDNGFRPGFSNQLEKMLHERMAGCQLRAIPHINSRIKLLKRQYNAIREMRSHAGSGFGWNEEHKMIVVEKVVFNDWVKSHPNARGLYNKPFPYFEELGLLFGRDVATGQDVEVPYVAGHEMESEEHLYTDSTTLGDDLTYMTGDNTEPPVGEPIPDMPTDEVTDQPTVSTSVVKNRNKRARAEDTVIAAVADAMKDLTQSYREGNEQMSKMVKLQTDNAEKTDKRLSILAELKKMQGLSGPQRAQVVRIMAKDANLTDIFLVGDDEDKYDLVCSLLHSPN